MPAVTFWASLPHHREAQLYKMVAYGFLHVAA